MWPVFLTEAGFVWDDNVFLVVPFFLLAGYLRLVTIWFQYNVAIRDEAIRHCSEALRIKPDRPSARFNPRLAMQAKGRASEKLRTDPPVPTF